jgi:hypothetical protein
MLRTVWQQREFPIAQALAAVEADRSTIDAFVSRDARGAAQIADYLELLRADLDTVEQTARDLAVSEPFWLRTCPHLSSGMTYSGLPLTRFSRFGRP